MKKICVLFFYCLIPFVFSCSFEIPEKVTLVTQAEYAFSLGTVSKSLSEYISVSKISDMVSSSGGSSGSTLEPTVYDYNPNGSSKVQEYLVDVPIQNIPVDISSYLDKVDFGAGENGEITVGKEVTIPSMSDYENTSNVDFPDIFSQFTGETINVLDNVRIPEIDLFGDNKIKIDFAIQDPAFSTIDFYEGGITLNLAKQDGAAFTDGFSSEFTFALYDPDSNTLLDKVEGVDIVTQSSVDFALAGKSISKNLRILISGSVNGGEASNNHYYDLTANFQSGTKFSRITGYTASSAFTSGNINQTLTIETDESFVECGIQTGSMELYTKMPSGWTGVAATITDESIGGALSWPSAAPALTDVTDNTCIFHKSLDLAQAVYSKETNGGTINFAGNLSFTCTNATLVFENGELPRVELKTKCSIDTVEYVEIDISSFQNDLAYEKTVSFPDDVKAYLPNIVLAQSGIEVTYTNTLPKGDGGTNVNAISTGVYSSLLGIGESDSSPDTKYMLAETVDGSLEFLSAEDSETTVNTSSDSIDFKVKLDLPRDSGMDANRAKLKYVRPGETYTLSAVVKPVFDWKEVTLNLGGAGAAQSGEVPLGISFDSMFSSFKEQLGDDSQFLNNISFASLPLYVYCEKPALEGLDGVGFSGSISFVFKKDGSEIGSPVALVLQEDTNGNIKTTSRATLEQDENGTVVSDVSVGDYSGSTDLATLLDTHRDGEISVKYNVSLGGGSGSTITITKEEFDALKNGDESASGSISISARLEIPLKLKIEDTIDSDQTTEIDIFKLAGMESDKDLFSRNKATSIDDVEKYIDLVEKTTLIYKTDNRFFVYQEKGNSIKFEFDSQINDMENPVYNMAVKSGQMEIYTSDVKKMLQTYPFTPTLKILLPDGTLAVPRDSGFGINMAVNVKTNGKIAIWEK